MWKNLAKPLVAMDLVPCVEHTATDSSRKSICPDFDDTCRTYGYVICSFNNSFLMIGELYRKVTGCYEHDITSRIQPFYTPNVVNAYVANAKDHTCVR